MSENIDEQDPVQPEETTEPSEDETPKRELPETLKRLAKGFLKTAPSNSRKEKT